MFPDLGEFTTGSADHVELADDSPSTKVEADESDDSDLYALSEVEKVWVRIVSVFATGEQVTEREGRCAPSCQTENHPSRSIR
jgi:hypothetical protein